MTDESKRCCKCKEEKILVDFHKSKFTKDGINTRCIKCVRNYRCTPENIEKERLARIRSKEKTAIYHKIYWIENKEKISNGARQYRINNKEKLLLAEQKYRKKSRIKISKKAKKSCEYISDLYCKQRIGIPASLITPELIELKRAQLLLSREIKNASK
jgi:hypothetical protein